jgi:hypothetical protein
VVRTHLADGSGREDAMNDRDIDAGLLEYSLILVWEMGNTGVG